MNTLSGNQDGIRLRRGTKGFPLNVVSDGALVPACYGYPPPAFNQQMCTELNSILQKSSVPQEVVGVLRQDPLDTGPFKPAGRGMALSCRTDLPLDESRLDSLTGWLHQVISKIRKYEGVSRTDSKPRVETCHRLGTLTPPAK